MFQSMVKASFVPTAGAAGMYAVGFVTSSEAILIAAALGTFSFLGKVVSTRRQMPPRGRKKQSIVQLMWKAVKFASLTIVVLLGYRYGVVPATRWVAGTYDTWERGHADFPRLQSRNGELEQELQVLARSGYVSQLSLGTDPGRAFDARRFSLLKAQDLAAKYGISDKLAQMALRSLESQVEAARPIALDSRIEAVPRSNTIAEFSPIRYLEFGLHAPADVTVPELMTKDITVRSGEKVIPVLACGNRRDSTRLQIVLALDISGSASGDFLKAERELAKDLLQRLSTEADLSVWAFRDTVVRVSPFGGDTRVASWALDGLVAQGGTALRQLVDTATNDLGRRSMPRMLIVITDGKDSVGGRSTADLIKLAKQHRVAIHTIGLRTAETDFRLLQDLAEQTGGSWQPLENASQLSARLDSVLRTLREPVYRVIVPADGVLMEPVTLHIGTAHKLNFPTGPQH